MRWAVDVHSSNSRPRPRLEWHSVYGLERSLTRGAWRCAVDERLASDGVACPRRAPAAPRVDFNCRPVHNDLISQTDQSSLPRWTGPAAWAGPGDSAQPLSPQESSADGVVQSPGSRLRFRRAAAAAHDTTGPAWLSPRALRPLRGGARSSTACPTWRTAPATPGRPGRARAATEALAKLEKAGAIQASALFRLAVTAVSPAVVNVQSQQLAEGPRVCPDCPSAATPWHRISRAASSARVSSSTRPRATW